MYLKGASVFARETANYKGPARGLGEQGGNGIYFRGRGEQRSSFEGNKGKKTIVGNREHKKSTKEGKDQESIQSSTTPDPHRTNFQFLRNKGTSQFISGKQGNRYPSFCLFVKLMLYVYGKHVAKFMLGRSITFKTT